MRSLVDHFEMGTCCENNNEHINGLLVVDSSARVRIHAQEITIQAHTHNSTDGVGWTWLVKHGRIGARSPCGDPDLKIAGKPCAYTTTMKFLSRRATITCSHAPQNTTQQIFTRSLHRF